MIYKRIFYIESIVIFIFNKNLKQNYVFIFYFILFLKFNILLMCGFYFIIKKV